MKSIFSYGTTVTTKKYFLLSAGVLLFSIVLLFFQLGKGAFVDYDEAAYAEVVYETLLHGNISHFYFDNKPWLEKPPLFLWTAMLSKQIIPDIEAAMRFPSALAGLITIVLTGALVHLITKKPSLALMASLILITTGSFLDIARQVRLDVPVTMMMLLSYYAFLRSYPSPDSSRRWGILIGISIALGCMIKSVIGLFGYIPIILHSLLRKNFSWLNDKFFWIGHAIGAVIILPWHIQQFVVHESEFLHIYINRHVLQRFQENLFPSDVSFFNIISMWFGVSFPWSLLFLCVCGGTCVYILKYRHFFKEKSIALPHIVPLATASLTALFILIIFGVSKTKAISYFTPAYPFMAISLALGVYSLQSYVSHSSQKKLLRYALIIFFVFALHTTLLIGFHKHQQFNLYNYEKVEEQKQIGLLLSHIDDSEIVYFYEKEHWETIRFYSKNKKLEWRGNRPTYAQNSYYLILPKEASETFTFSVSDKIVFQGDHLILVRIGAATFANSMSQYSNFSFLY